MNPDDFWRIVTSTQVATALVLIAGALVYIAVKLSGKGVSKTAR